jgi:GT2 family glycosyltransferase
MQKLAVVILNYNGRKHLETFLPSVVEFSKPFNIILADNASKDDSISYVESRFPEIEIIRNKRNDGFAKGYNDALDQLKGRFEFYLLLNSDVEVTENWIEQLLSAFKDKNIAACQPKILSYLDKTKFEHAGAAGGFIDENYFPFCRGRIFEETIAIAPNAKRPPIDIKRDFSAVPNRVRITAAAATPTRS